jgi:NTE family protein
MQTNQKSVNLALQGGGAHGAFTWGVIDKLLEDGWIAVEAISATSAGAMNAIAYAYGASIGGPDGARGKLEEFWREVSRAGRFLSPVQAYPWEKWFNLHDMDNPLSFQTVQALAHTFSPYQLNPLNLNPLKDVLMRVVDFDRLSRSKQATRLYISATNVRTGKIKVFENEAMSPDVVLASACLPNIFQAVEIDGEHYWDGGYMGNPAIYPLIYNSQSRDVIIVHVNPLERVDLPTTAPQILNRINEISFNSSLLRELRAIAFVTQLIDAHVLDKKQFHRMLIHSIRADEEMVRLGISSKLNPDWNFLCHLRDIGRATTAAWLECNYDQVNRSSTIDIHETYL